MKATQEELITDVIQAAGGLLWRSNDHVREIAVLHRPHRNDWTFPKGKMEPGESWQETALREVWEETGYLVKLESFAGSVAYTFNGVAKVVLYWHMSLVQEGVFKPNHEVDQLIWLSATEAQKKLDYRGERALIKKAILAMEK
jgi:8-oxo-dGTP pyrophosphatase MutT (NUDIX family)